MKEQPTSLWNKTASTSAQIFPSIDASRQHLEGQIVSTYKAPPHSQLTLWGMGLLCFLYPLRFWTVECRVPLAIPCPCCLIIWSCTVAFLLFSDELDNNWLMVVHHSQVTQTLIWNHAQHATETHDKHLVVTVTMVEIDFHATNWLL